MKLGKSRTSEAKVRAAGIGLLEKHVQRAITGMLQLDGWRAIKTDPVSDRGRGKGFGEKGMADHLFIRYHCAPGSRCPDPAHSSNRAQAIAEVLWVEFKKPGEKPESHQTAWHEAERARGALIVVIDDIDAGIAWYNASGLRRR